MWISNDSCHQRGSLIFRTAFLPDVTFMGMRFTFSCVPCWTLLHLLTSSSINSFFFPSVPPSRSPTYSAISSALSMDKMYLNEDDKKDHSVRIEFMTLGWWLYDRKPMFWPQHLSTISNPLKHSNVLKCVKSTRFLRIWELSVHQNSHMDYPGWWHLLYLASLLQIQWQQNYILSYSLNNVIARF